MSPKGVFQRKDGKDFTGFVVTYDNGNKIYEIEDYFSKKLNKKCATNWAEVDKSKITLLQLYWKGVLKETIHKTPDDIHKNELIAKNWFFSQKGYLDMGTRKIVVIARNIGYIEGDILHITSIIELTGEINRSVRGIPQ
jgi:hypothetical protein